MKKLIMLSALALGLAALTGCEGDRREPNRRELLDRNRAFTKATIDCGNTNAVYDMVAWMDYDRSDTVQLWVKDEASPRGRKVVLAHYSRVVLENPSPKYDPKF